MSADIHELTLKNFDSEIKKGKWVIDFWAVWCGPCKIMEPHFEAAAKELKGKVHFGKVNVDEEYELAQRFEIMSIPTTLFFKDGKMVYGSVGAIDKAQILNSIKENL